MWCRITNSIPYPVSLPSLQSNQKLLDDDISYWLLNVCPDNDTINLERLIRNKVRPHKEDRCRQIITFFIGSWIGL